MTTLTMTQPDDWHLHLRDGHMLQETVPASARCFARATVMPNLTPPITNASQAIAYKNRILTQSPGTFEPLMTLYLTDNTTAQDIADAKEAGIPAVKLYPAGATTNSSAGVTNIEKLTPVFEALVESKMLLLIHGEVTHEHVDIFDREKYFIDERLIPLIQRFPNLKIVMEHITTKDAADFVHGAGPRIAATITPQHLLLNRNDLLVGGIRPHNYCLPILKRRTHQEALRAAVASGSKQFFLGTDSAPHDKDAKESACGCAGCYSAWAALELYTQVFEELGKLELLEGFASHHGADFYGVERNKATITLVREPWTVPETITLANGATLVPFMAGAQMQWRLQNPV